MLVEVLTIVRDRLTDPAAGVAALLAAVPRDVGAPALPAVAVVTQLERPTAALGPVEDELLGEFPAGTALLLVAVFHEVALPVQFGLRAHEGAAAGDAVVPVTLRYVPPLGADPATVGYAALLVLRCAARALVAPALAGSQAGLQQVRNTAVVKAPATAHFGPPPPELAGVRYVPSLTVPFPARDPWVLGA